MKILIVEDDVTVAKLLRDLVLADNGSAEIRGVVDLESALKTCREWRPGIVLLDLQLGEVSPNLTIEMIPVISSVASVVAVSGFTSYSIAALRRGACEFVSKPVDPRQLLAAIRHASSRGRFVEKVGVAADALDDAKKRIAAMQ